MSANKALLDACWNGDNAAVEAAIAQGADVNCLIGVWTPLMCAALCGHVATIRLLVSKGADVNKTNVYGNTAFRFAAQKGRSNAVKTLAQLGADVNKRNTFGGSPIYTAAANGQPETVAMLVQLGADASTPRPSGDTPISIAAAENHPHCVRVLVDSNAARDGSAAALELMRVGLRYLAAIKQDAACTLLTASQKGESCPF